MRASRVAVLVSVQLCWAMLASGRALAGGALDAWSGLWRTPDQQGQALLDAGNPAAAADRFRDPRRRAFADLQAGRNGDAAKLLGPFTDAQSEYNRGNALARSGQLQPALAAYDAALKQSPADKDIRHNRDLVARALQQQRQSSPRSNGKGGGKSGSSGQQQAGGGQQKGSGSQQSGSQGKQSAGKAAPNGSQPGGDLADRSGQQRPGQTGADTAHETPDQAKQDAAEAAAFARQKQGANAGKTGQASVAARAAASGAKDAGKGAEAPGMQTPKQQAENERQLALDQWLRQIPDSPAGLLQRKFLIEHMMKEQNGDEDPQGGGP
jgi:Ca-activated chloride channel family protein